MALVRKELVRLDEQVAPDLGRLDEEVRFRFRHQLVRDAAYEALPKHERAHLHEVFADWMESALANRIDELHEVIGYHLEQACLYLRSVGRSTEAADRLAERAVEHLAAGADKARATGDTRAVLRLLDRAISLLPPGDLRRLRLLPRLADARADIGLLEDAQAAVDEVLGSDADPATRAEALELVELQFERDARRPTSHRWSRKRCESAASSVRPTGSPERYSPARGSTGFEVTSMHRQRPWKRHCRWRRGPGT